MTQHEHRGQPGDQEEAEQQAQKIIADGQVKAETLKKEKLALKDEMYQLLRKASAA